MPDVRERGRESTVLTLDFFHNVNTCLKVNLVLFQPSDMEDVVGVMSQCEL